MRQRETVGIAVLIAVAAATAYADARSDPIHAKTAGGVAAGADGPPVVDCESRAQIIPPRHPGRQDFDRRRDLIAGPLVLLSAKRWGNVRRRALRPDPGELEPVKIPFFLKARRRVTVTISPPEGRTAELGVALDVGPSVSGPSVELRACRRKDRVAGRRVGPWTMYPAGYRIDGPMCLGVTVEVEGRTKPIQRRIAFGRGACKQPIIVTLRKDIDYRPHCAPRQLGKRLRRYSRALHTVDAKALRRIWGPGRVWFGFSLRPPNRLVRSYDEGLRFLRRHGGLRLRFKEVRMYGGGNVGLEGVYRSRKSGRERLVGKATFSCRTPRLKGGGVGAGKDVGDIPDCPKPTEPAPKTAMIVCHGRAEAGPSPEG